MAARVTFSVEVTPSPAFLATMFFGTQEQLQHLEEPLHECARIGSTEIAQNFSSQGRPETWQPLTEQTMERRVWKSLSDAQQASLRDLKRDSAFEGEYGPADETGKQHFIPSTTSKYAQIFAGLTQGMQILIDTGALRTGAISEENWTYRKLDWQTQSIDVADPTGYGTPHITGGPNLPVRDWTYISPEAVDEMAATVADWVSQ